MSTHEIIAIVACVVLTLAILLALCVRRHITRARFVRENFVHIPRTGPRRDLL